MRTPTAVQTKTPSNFFADELGYLLPATRSVRENPPRLEMVRHHCSSKVLLMFETVTAAPPDAILGLTEAFKKDPRADKLNLSVGVFKDDAGRTPVLKCVKEAERRLLEAETSKTYLSIEGSPEYGRAVRELMFGADHEVVRSQRACTAQCPGGTGALRVAADFVRKLFPAATVWFSTPTWPNHQGIFKSAGLNVEIGRAHV